MKVFVKYSTMREVKVFNLECDSKSETVTRLAISDVVLRERNKYVKIIPLKINAKTFIELLEV